MFVYLRKDGELDGLVRNLSEKGHPVYTCAIDDLYDLPAEFYRWEIATAVACVLLNVNAFDQPNVQESKDITRQMITALQNKEVIDVGSAFVGGRGDGLFRKRNPQA